MPFCIKWRSWRQWRKLFLVSYMGLFGYLFFYNDRNPRCRTTMPEWTGVPAPDPLLGGACRPDFEDLGLVTLDLSPPNISHIEAENREVNAGGQWAPSGCENKQTIAILVAYRDRWNQLQLLLKRLHPMLRQQKVSYQIFVVEQAGDDIFNKGMLFNIGVKESVKMSPFNCFIFHDVDMLPENDKNIYYCDENLRHFPSALDEMRYHVMYCNLAGGAVALTYDNVLKANGYSNSYWGWGAEDDDFSARTREVGLLITRPPQNIGRYKMVRHSKNARASTAYEMLLTWKSRWRHDGLNSLDESKYKVLQIEKLPLFTKLLIDVGKSPIEKPNLEGVPKVGLWWLWKFFYD